MEKELFVKHYLRAASEAGGSFKLNPVVILAQAAIESGWGESMLARAYHSFFGLTAYGLSNEFWTGSRTNLSEMGDASQHLIFRSYISHYASFFDYARLISVAYPVATALSFTPTAYAQEIAYSPCLSEVNSDNRAHYQRMLCLTIRTIERIIARQDNATPLSSD